ncbi:MAG TPA: ABC transporter permease [Streptosporangiaceae bacterium]|jgi:putative ABC transport system permease protein|nr:ABC transporter permease [Streptosporangiaceae bacterium]
MRGGPVARAVRGGVSRRRLRTIVIGLVLLVSTGASVLALALVVDSSSPFDHAFAAQRGAHIAASIDTAATTPADLAATTRRPGVTAAAGPFPTAAVLVQAAGTPGTLPPLTLAGRASPGGPVDDLTLESGHWPQRPGQLVLEFNQASNFQFSLPLGTRMTVTSVPGHPKLTVVGEASSITNSASGWVVPAEVPALRAPGSPPSVQMLYRFRGAATDAAIHADTAAIGAALPPGSLTGTQSYLSAKATQISQIGPFVPFLVAFGVIGLVLSVLIVANVVSGAVVAGYRRIGVLKSIGFTPGQVVAAYTGQIAVPAVVGVLAGLVVGNLLASMLLRQTANVYGVGTLGVPVWVDVAVPAGMLALVAVAAVLPAVRAGRLSAVRAITAGRAPRTGRGYAAHRLLGRLGQGKLALPRPVTIGLAAPFARPARSTATLVAVLLGATTVTFAVGLGASLGRVVEGLSRASAQPVQIWSNSSRDDYNLTSADQRAIVTALRSQPGTLRYTDETNAPAGLAGQSVRVAATAFTGKAGWTGYPMIHGHWYTGPGQIVASTGFLGMTDKTVGDTVTITFGATSIPVRIVGEDFAADNRGVSVVTDWRTLAAASPAMAQPDQIDVALRPGISVSAYAQAVGNRLGAGYAVNVNSRKSVVVNLMFGVIGLLTLMLAVVAGLGVLNGVVLQTRERVHDLGVFKALGMTPRQVIAMVVCWVAGVGLLAGLLAIPAGMALHGYVLPVMASSANLGLPATFLNVYLPWELAGLALAGVVIAVAGALLPAGWAARMRTAAALRAE